MKMLKTLALSLVILALLAGTAFAYVTVRYHNSDSQKHTFNAVCSGSSYTLEVDASTTASYTIQGSSPCKVKHAGGEIELKGGENIEIKNGVITIQ